MSLEQLADADVRRTIRTELDRTLFVEAGAGTGKTTVLVERIVNLVAADCVRMAGLVAITFTEAAAAELRDRVREALERAAIDPDRTVAERARCRQAALDIDRAAISTIHSFAGQVLRTFPLEAGLPPGFATLDEIQQATLFDDRFTTWFWHDALSDPLRGVLKRALLLGLKQDAIRALAADLDEHHDLLGPETTWEATEPDPALPLAQTIGRTLVNLQRSIPFAHDPEDPLVQAVRGAQSNARQLLAAQSEDDALTALLDLGTLKTDVAPDAWGETANGVNVGVETSDRLDRINRLRERMLEAHRSTTFAALLGHLRDFVLAGVRQRRSDGVATFQDLLAWTRDLLRHNPAVRHAAQRRYGRIFIDEFQDTDPLQAEIAFYLAADESDGRELPPDWRDAALEPGKLFLVGDPKQSIYRFRGADIATYDELLDRLRDCRVWLTHNFRSVRPVLDWVNHHFGQHMQPSAGYQPEYVPLEAEWPAHPEVDCGVRRVGGLLNGSAADAAEAEALAFASLARSAVEDSWRVTDPDTRLLRPATYRDICILLPARTHLRRLERALEQVGVPYRVEAGKLVLATQEVRDLLASLRAIEDPSDQVALVAALRSPAYACSDVDLLRWVEGGGHLDHEHPGGGPDGPVKDALASLADFHRRRMLLSPAALIETFMADRLLVASAFGEPRPREAWRRLRYVVSRARAFTSTGRHTLRAFLDWLEGLQRAEVRDPESGSAESDEDAIHIQTIHSAKGLEYPIVFLGGLASHGRGRSSGPEVIANRQSRSLACRASKGWQTSDYEAAARREQDMESAQAVRLLYVAATRARDHLVVGLFRGHRSERYAAAIIERRLEGAAPEMCPPLAIPGYAERATPVEIDSGSGSGSVAEPDAESAWAAERLHQVESASTPTADSSWWTPEPPRAPLYIRPPEGVTVFRRNVSLLAQVDGRLLEEYVDLAYRTADGYVLVIAAPDSAADAHPAPRAQAVAQAFERATGCSVSRVDIL